MNFVIRTIEIILQLGFTFVFMWSIMVLMSFSLSMTGLLFGIIYNKNKNTKSRLFNTGLLSIFGLFTCFIFPPIGIIGGLLAISWKHDSKYRCRLIIET